MLKDFESLDTAKGRRRTGLFVAEGEKCVGELMRRFHCRYLFVRQGKDVASYGCEYDELIPVDGAVMRTITRLSSSPDVIAFFEQPEALELPAASFVRNNLVLALDRIQDPGNLGTILRCCDWMGVHTVVASQETVDVFNPKTVQASMGALARVEVVYADLVPFIKSLGAATPVYGTFLDGDNIYTEPLSKCGLVIMGNEGSGISPEVALAVNRRLLIPSWPPVADTVESLNVGMATAIVLSQFRSRLFHSR